MRYKKLKLVGQNNDKLKNRQLRIVCLQVMFIGRVSKYGYISTAVAYKPKIARSQKITPNTNQK